MGRCQTAPAMAERIVSSQQKFQRPQPKPASPDNNPTPKQTACGILQFHRDRDYRERPPLPDSAASHQWETDLFPSSTKPFGCEFQARREYLAHLRKLGNLHLLGGLSSDS